MKKLLILFIGCIMSVVTSFAQGAYEYDRGMQEAAAGNLKEAADWFKKSGNLGYGDGWDMYAVTCEALWRVDIHGKNWDRYLRFALNAYWDAQNLGCKDIKEARDRYAKYIASGASAGIASLMVHRARKSIRRLKKKYVTSQMWLQKGIWNFKYNVGEYDGNLVIRDIPK